MYSNIVCHCITIYAYMFHTEQSLSPTSVATGLMCCLALKFLKSELIPTYVRAVIRITVQ